MSPTFRIVARGALSLAVAPLLGVAALVYLARREPPLTGVLLPEYQVMAKTAGSAAVPIGATIQPTDGTLSLGGAPDEEFEILAQPRHSPAPGKVVAFVFAMGEEEPNPVEAKVLVTPSGEVRVRGRARALREVRELRVVLGTATDSITRYDDAFVRARSGVSDAKVRVVGVSVVRR